MCIFEILRHGIAWLYFLHKHEHTRKYTSLDAVKVEFLNYIAKHKRNILLFWNWSNFYVSNVKIKKERNGNNVVHHWMKKIHSNWFGKNSHIPIITKLYLKQSLNCNRAEVKLMIAFGMRYLKMILWKSKMCLHRDLLKKKTFRFSKKKWTKTACQRTHDPTVNLLNYVEYKWIGTLREHFHKLNIPYVL